MKLNPEEYCGISQSGRRRCGGRLCRVLLFFRPERHREAAALALRLEAEGLKAQWTDLRSFRPEENRGGTLALTDDEQQAYRLQKSGIVCFGFVFPQGGAGQETGWFRNVPLVLENPEEIDARYLEEWYLRVQGFPAEIVSAGALTLREIAAKDVAELARIASEPEVRPYVRDGNFTAGWLNAYRRQAYRLQGYGLWSVFFREKLIGCCGFAPWDAAREEEERRAGRIVFALTRPAASGSWPCRDAQGYPEAVLSLEPEYQTSRGLQSCPKAGYPAGPGSRLCAEEQGRPEAALMPEPEYQTSRGLQSCPKASLLQDPDSGDCLELQYFLDGGYRRRGLGLAMCRAALAYARERLGIEAFRIVVPAENTASRALAGRLGFEESM